MRKPINRKKTIIYVLKMLRKGSSKDHPISQLTIANVVSMLLGFTCDRKTVARDIDCLIECGYDIVKLPGIGVYYNGPDFSIEEFQTIIKAVDNLESLDEIQKQKLKTKIELVIKMEQNKGGLKWIENKRGNI